jgi:glycosyltransferase involved in cell wall biosynthesis
MQASILKSAGYDVHIATGGRLTSSRLDDALGIQVHEFKISGADFLLHPIKGDVIKYQNFLKSSNFDILIFNAWQTWSTDIAIKMLSKINGKKIVFSHGVSTNLIMNADFWRSIVRYIFWRPYWWRMKSVVNNLGGLIFLSESGLDCRFDDLKLARKLSIPFSIVPNALSHSSSMQLEGKSLDFATRNGFISVGSYEWAKGHDFVIRSYSKSQFKNKVPLRIFGQKFTAYTNSLRMLAIELGLRDDMVFFYEGISGEDLLSYYSSSAIFLYGSHTECQPLVLLDAMATGTPFVARASGCISSMCGGISVASEIECASQINYLMSDEEEWQRYSSAGKGDASRNYHPDTVRDQLLAAIAKNA